MKKEAGQALILVLILLAIGALLVVPALRLSYTELKFSRLITGKTEKLYALNAAQEWMLWNLTQPGFIDTFTIGVPKEFPIDVCGTPVTIYIVMQAKPGQGGVSLATEHVIRPTKTVDTGNDPPDFVPNDTTATCTYIIRLDHLSDNNTQGLDAIYDILPKTFLDTDYVTNSSELSVDGGPWESVPDPSFAVEGGQVRLKWPADYDPVTETGTFSSNPDFLGIQDFEVRQVKELKFEVTHEFKGEDKNTVLCNWVVLKPWNTVSGPQAPITVGDVPPDLAGLCKEGGLLAVDKVSDPEVIQPGVEADIEYTISITNLDTETRMLDEITDYLPPGFSYTDNSTSGSITNFNPQMSLENLNGVDRWKLRWTTAEFPGGGAKSIGSTETVTLTFWVTTTKDISGSYYNEVLVIPDVPVPTIFSEIGVSPEEYFTCYSWNTGAVMVPYFDSEAEADGESIDTNFSLSGGGVEISSWQIR